MVCFSSRPWTLQRRNELLNPLGGSRGCGAGCGAVSPGVWVTKHTNLIDSGASSLLRFTKLLVVVSHKNVWSGGPVVAQWKRI